MDFQVRSRGTILLCHIVPLRQLSPISEIALLSDHAEPIGKFINVHNSALEADFLRHA